MSCAEVAAQDALAGTRIGNATFCVIDVETTGLDPETDELVEIACAAYCRWASTPKAMFATLVRPTKVIPPEVSAVHHLRNDDLTLAPTQAGSMLLLDDFAARLGPNVVLVAHNLAFDAPMLRRAYHPDYSMVVPLLPAVCTRRLAQHLVPDAPTFKNQGLRYFFDLDVDTFGIMPHRALADALVTGALLQKLLSLDGCPQTVEGLIDLAESPIEYKRMPFGKHRDQALDDVPTDYLAYCLRSMADLDADLCWSMERSLERRGALSAAS